MNDWLSLSPYVYYSPDFLQTGAKATYAGGIVKVTIPSAMMPTDWGAYISGEAAHYWIGTLTAFGAPFIDLPDYTYWNAGVGFTFKIFTVDFRHHRHRPEHRAVASPSPAIRAASSAAPARRAGAASPSLRSYSFDMTLNNNIK